MRDDQQLDGDDARPDGFHLDRRKLIAGAAVGGAAAWAAPSILSMSAAAAASAGGGGGGGSTPGSGPYAFAGIPFVVPSPNNPQNVINGGDDVLAGPVALPFGFRFYGIVNNSISVSSNGVVHFGANANAAFTNNTLPDTPAQDNALFPYWDDLINGQVNVWTIGSAPNRSFVVQWLNWSHFGSGGGPFTFYALLNETTMTIDFVYDTLNGVAGEANGESATVGVQGFGTATQYSFNTANSIPNSSAIRASG